MRCEETVTTHAAICPGTDELSHGFELGAHADTDAPSVLQRPNARNQIAHSDWDLQSIHEGERVNIRIRVGVLLCADILQLPMPSFVLTKMFDSSSDTLHLHSRPNAEYLASRC